MSDSSLSQTREQSAWLALTAAVLIATVTIGLTLLHPGGSQAFNPLLEAGLSVEPPQERGEQYKSPQQCRECHIEEFRAWSRTPHADASFDPVFQVALQRVAEPGECFTCHTTGYDTTTGHFMLSGVTCEACHGPYRPDHPEESMVVAGSEELCGACHTSTLTEWVNSRHYTAGVTCVECHEVHTQTTRVSDSRNALCAGCHHDQLGDANHTRHLDAGVYCVTCHMARPKQTDGDPVRGQLATGHVFAVYIGTCDDCHPLGLAPSPVGIQ